MCLYQGMAYCGVVGHNTRKEYMIIGTPLTYAKGMMEISYDKVIFIYVYINLLLFSFDIFLLRLT